MQGTRQIHGEHAPGNYFSMCHWLIANYKIGHMAPGWESQAWYADWWSQDFGLRGELPVVAALKTLPSVVVDREIEANAVITGKALRADTHEALAGLTVRLLAASKGVATTQTGTDGTFTLARLTAGMYDLAIDGYGTVRTGVAAVGGTVQPVVIRLAGGRSSVLSGFVQNASGAAVAGVEVSLQRDGQPVGRTTSGTDGAFRFATLTLGVYRLSIPGITIDGIALDGWQAKSLKLTTGVAPAYKYVVDKKRLLPPEETNNRHLFYGVATDALGGALNGIKVQMSWFGAPAGTNFPTKITGSDPYKPAGYYEFLHTPGTFALQVAQGEWPSDQADGLETANVPSRDGQAITYEVNFRLQPAGGPAQVDGVITGGQAGRKVTLAAIPGSVGTPPTRQVALATNGAFAFPNTATGTYQLTLEGVGVISRNITIAPGELFKVLLSLRSRLSGKVTSPPEGLVAVLYAPQAWGWTRQVPLAAEGGFAFENLPPGRYRMEIGGQVLSDLALTGENRLALAPVDLTTGRRSVVRGRVAAAAGQPKPGLVVTLKREGAVTAETIAATDGTYRFANLPGGRYSVEVTGLGVLVDNLALGGEREAVVDAVWQQSKGLGGTLQGRVLNANGKPKSYALVRLLKGSAEVEHVEADAKGVFRFTGPEAGTYAISVGDGEPLVPDVVVRDDTTVVRDVTMSGGPPNVIARYLLFAPPPASDRSGSAEARLLLGLTMHYLTGEVAGGFSIEEAKAAFAGHHRRRPRPRKHGEYPGGGGLPGDPTER